MAAKTPFAYTRVRSFAKRYPQAKRNSCNRIETVDFVSLNKRIKIMRTVQFNIPDNVDLKDYDFSMIVAAKLYEDAKVSAGEAAEIAGLTKRAFIEILGKYGVSVFSSSIDDLHSDIANA